MTTYHIATFVGSLRWDSINLKLAQAMTKLAPAEFHFKFVAIGDLPLYNQEHDSDQAESVKRMKKEIRTAQGLLFVTPEYNRSIPSALKNAIDHGSRPRGDSAWSGKPAGILGASIGAIGTAAAQQHLRNILASLDVPTMAQPEVFIQAKDGLFDTDGQINAASRELLQTWMNHYVAWIKKLN